MGPSSSLPHAPTTRAAPMANTSRGVIRRESTPCFPFAHRGRAGRSVSAARASRTRRARDQSARTPPARHSSARHAPVLGRDPAPDRPVLDCLGDELEAMTHPLGPLASVRYDLDLPEPAPDRPGCDCLGDEVEAMTPA